MPEPVGVQQKVQVSWHVHSSKTQRSLIRVFDGCSSTLISVRIYPNKFSKKAIKIDLVG